MEVTRLTLVTAPAAEPVALDDVKRHMRLDEGAFNADVTSLIKSARIMAETITRRALILQTWDYKLDAFVSEFSVPLPPLSSVTSIKYIDTDGVEQTLSAANYSVDTDSEPARIKPAYGLTWPSTRDVMNAVVIRFIAGYGASATDVPEPIRQAIKILVTHWFENPELISPLIKQTPMSVQSLLGNYRVLTEF